MTQRNDTGHFPPAHDLACVPTSLIPTPGARMELTMSVHHIISEEE